MNRRDFLKTAGAPALLAMAQPTLIAGTAETSKVTSRFVPTTNIRDYLSREALRITRNALANPPSASEWKQIERIRRAQFLEMMGLAHLPELQQHPPVKVTVTGVIERPGYRIEKLHYESLPGLHVTANLYVPSNIGGPAPGVLYVCGHASNQKVHYQAHPRRFAQLGFVCLIVETIQLGEVAGYHHGCYREGWFHWYSLGYTPAGVELLNGIRGLDLLAQRPEVDPDRLGVTGISGGGATSWWLAAADSRVKVAAPVCGTATLYSHIHDRTIDGHCDCMWWVNTYGWDLADVGALVAPRPLLIASADRDGIFTLESIRMVHAQLGKFYRKLGAPQNLKLVITPGGHSYHQISRTAIFSWFARHLQNRDVPPDQIGDIDDSPEKSESADTLRVYVSGPPADNRVATIHQTFVPLPAPPRIQSRADLEKERHHVVSELREKTFRAFPQKAPPLDVQIEFEYEDGNECGFRFAFTSEDGWRLHGKLWRPKNLSSPMPILMAPRMAGEGRTDTRSFLNSIPFECARVEFEPRGTGETAWGDELNWHIRRAAAWTGRTVASMRVWDTLRALAAIRTIREAGQEPISLAAREDAAAYVAYAALLDGQIQNLFLQSPPATQNAPSQKDGRGPAIEMLYCLRVTDLPIVVGLLFPTRVVLGGDVPDSYNWAKDLYSGLGGADRFQPLRDLRQWKSA